MVDLSRLGCLSWRPAPLPPTSTPRRRHVRAGTRRDSLIPAGNTRNVGLVVAVVALIAGAALALGSGDLRGLIVLALGAAGGWAAGQSLAARPRTRSEGDERPVAAERAALARPARATARVGEAPRAEPAARTGRLATPISAASAPIGAAPPDAPAPAAAAARLTERRPSTVPAPITTPSPAARPVADPAATPPGRAAAAAARPPLAAAPPGLPPEHRAKGDDDRDGERGSTAANAGLGPTPAASGLGGGAAAEMGTPLPTEARLQDLAARQRSSTADLRRSIRDVIERLEDEEPPPARRRKKSRS